MTFDPLDDPAARPTRLPWPPLVLTITLFGGWLMQHMLPLPWPGLDDTPARLVGLGFGLAGLALLAVATWTLHSRHTTFLPHRPASTLVTTGPYRRLRNPIYLSYVLMFFCLAELSKNIWMVVAAFAFAALITLLAILPEERHLAARFGDAWRAYAARSRRWI